jgi:molybdopterin synthase sulfur carrier subunit
MIDVLFFGRMADIMRTRSLKLDVSEPKRSLFSLRDELFGESAETGRVTLNLVQMSINQAVTREDRVLEDGDEVAFFSVFSGG